MPGWTSSTRRDRLPANWPTIRRRILRRDRHQCQVIKEDGTRCLEYATDVDHKQAGDDHRDENLQAICSWHHRKKSSREGGQASAQAKRARAPRGRPEEPHPYELWKQGLS